MPKQKVSAITYLNTLLLSQNTQQDLTYFITLSLMQMTAPKASSKLSKSGVRLIIYLA